MKFTKYFMPFAALALLASCSNDKLDAPGVDDKPVQGDGSMYMTVNVSLPKVSTTKALEDYDEGLDAEYAVKAVDLLLFKLDAEGDATDPEANAKYVETLHLGFGDLTNNSASDITGDFNATFRISNIELDDNKRTKDGSKYYGLLIVNPLPENGDIKMPTLTAGTSTFNTWNSGVMTGLTDSDLNQDYTKYQINDNGFMMTNAPEYWNANKVTVLVEIDTENFALSPEEANENDPAAEFYVQRGVAKVYVTAANNADFDEMDVYYNDDDEVRGDAAVKVVNWALDVTNQLTFTAQNVVGAATTAENYEFKNWNFWYVHDSLTGEEFDHFWWGVDPNYYASDADEGNHEKFSNPANTENFTFTLKPGYDSDEPDDDTYAYCLENTMNYDQQLQGQSTRVVFNCLYTFTGDEEEDWSDTNTNVGFVVYNDKAVLIKTADKVATDLPLGGTGVELSSIVAADKLDTYARNLLMGSDQKVDWYPGGVTYYVSYIRHFDDDEAKMPTGTDTSSKDFTKDTLKTWSYPQLGRYGVLRNNAYDISVLGFFGYGSPTVPTPDPGTPDDKTPEKAYNAVVKVHVLNWAVRSTSYIPR